MRELDVAVGERTVHVYDAGGDGRPVVWFHGTPNVGAPPAPLFADAERLGLRWVGYDRPGYGGSTARPGRDVASAAEDVAAVADGLGLDRLLLMSHSGGGPHALACAALLPDRVAGAAVVASLAPRDAARLDWYAGMAPGGADGLRAAETGRAARTAHLASDESGPGFTEADEAMFDGPWGWLIDVVRPALASGPEPHVDDDLAYVGRWGFDPASIVGPTLLVHGADDLVDPAAHSSWLADRIPGAELWLRPGDGHISVLTAAPDALAWLAERR